MNKEEFSVLNSTVKSYVHSAAKCSPLMKQRSMDADCFFHKDPSEVLSSMEALAETDITLEEEGSVLRRRLYATLGNTYTGRRISRLLQSELEWEFGKGCLVYEPVNRKEVCEALSGFRGGPGPFYIVEDIFLAEFTDVTVLFYIGSDE